METKGQKVIRFIETYCLIPEGSKVGQPFKLEDFQKKFITDVYDNPHGTRKAIMSLARKNGKTALLAGILLCHIVGNLRKENSQIVSGAMSRDQAALIYNLMEKMLNLNPKFKGLYKCTPSKKTIIGLRANVEYKALSADGTTAHGLSPIVAILDEVGQVRGAITPFIEAIMTSQGAYEDPLLLMISTQAPSDADFLSQAIDDAIRSNDPHIVCHLYTSDKEADLENVDEWYKANPALGKFRSLKDMEEQVKEAKRIPSLEASVRNLLLNQRISLDSLWLAPTVWSENSGSPMLKVFQENPTYLGLDLSMRNDLTAAVMAAKDEEGVIHLLPFAFTPSEGVRDRALRDKTPYPQWIDSGHLIAVPSRTMDYEWFCEFMKMKVDDLGVQLHGIEFDRWRINELKNAAERTGFAQEAIWHEVGQGYQSMSPRIECFETYLLQKKIRHGNHPLLNLGASGAIVIRDPAGNRKIDKSKAGQKIDALIAAVMGVGAFMVEDEKVDISTLIF